MLLIENGWSKLITVLLLYKMMSNEVVHNTTLGLRTVESKEQSIEICFDDNHGHGQWYEFANKNLRQTL
jgi:hypothetical protein